MTPSIELHKRAIAMHTEALAFLLRHDGEELTDPVPLLERCTAHLSATFGVSRDTALSAAAIALGERTARDCGYYIDCSRTTSFVLHLVHAKTKRRHVLSVSDLVADLPDHG